eukprot:scaffold33787_cov71-Phaeocystis_antarctica.AAC.3
MLQRSTVREAAPNSRAPLKLAHGEATTVPRMTSSAPGLGACAPRGAASSRTPVGVASCHGPPVAKRGSADASFCSLTSRTSAAIRSSTAINSSSYAVLGSPALGGTRKTCSNTARSPQASRLRVHHPREEGVADRLERDRLLQDVRGRHAALDEEARVVRRLVPLEARGVVGAWLVRRSPGSGDHVGLRITRLGVHVHGPLEPRGNMRRRTILSLAARRNHQSVVARGRWRAERNCERHWRPTEAKDKRDLAERPGDCHADRSTEDERRREPPAPARVGASFRAVHRWAAHSSSSPSRAQLALPRVRENFHSRGS